MRRLMTDPDRDEAGAVILIAALAMFAVMALAALAIDGGLSHNDRSRAQNGADNAAMAAAWAVCEDRDPMTAGLATAWANGLGSPASDSLVDVVDLGDGRVEVTVSITREAEFGKAIGTNEIGASARAVASCATRYEGAGAIPFGVPPSGFAGGLQDPNPCGENSGNCGRLYSLRLDGIGDIGDDTRRNIARGTDRLLIPWSTGEPYVNCSLELDDPQCNVLPSNTGVSAGQLGEGFIERFSDLEGSNPAYHFTYRSHTLNGDPLEEVLGTAHGGATAVPLGSVFGGASPPPQWNSGIHGDWGSVNLDEHYWVSGEIAKCDSPRLASTLIVTADMTYDPEDYPGVGHPDPWPTGSQPMKVLGHYLVYIDDPNDPTDFQGSGNLKRASAQVLWLDPAEGAVTCADDTMPGAAATNPEIREVGLWG